MGCIKVLMTELIIYLFGFLFGLSECFYQKYQFLDLKTQRNLKWKTIRVLRATLIFSITITPKQYDPSLQDVLLSSAIYWVVFEIGTNAISLGADWFYVGVSGFDYKFGVKKWYVVFSYFLLTLVIKLFI